MRHVYKKIKIAIENEETNIKDLFFEDISIEQGIQNIKKYQQVIDMGIKKIKELK